MERLTPSGLAHEAFDEIYVLSFRHSVTVPESALVAANEADVRWLRERLDGSVDPYSWSVDPATGTTYVLTDDPVLGGGCAALARGELHLYRQMQRRREGQ